MSKLLSYAFVSLSLVACANACKSTDDGAATSKADVAPAPLAAHAYFHDTFAASREAFLTRVRAKTSDELRVSVETRRLPSWEADADLATDFVHFKRAAAKSSRLIVMTSGVHGIEGYTASAVQSLFLDEQIARVLEQGVDVLLIHGINAHGFKHKGRYTESRVDLNRTWFAAETFPKDLDDGGYARFNDLFNPTGKPRFGRLDFHGFVLTKLTPRISSITSGKLTRAAGIGQYRFPKGIIYGGNDFQPHRQMVLDVATPILSTYDRVMGWDVHTGLGKKQMQLLPNPPYSERIGALRRQVFEVLDRKIEDTGGIEFYSSHGDFSDFLCQIHERLKPEGTCVSMLLEYGTLMQADWDDPRFAAGIRATIDQAYTLYVNVRENQMYHHGAATEADRAEMREAYEALFYPRDPAWRTMVIDEARKLLPAITERFVAL